MGLLQLRWRASGEADRLLALPDTTRHDVHVFGAARAYSAVDDEALRNRNVCQFETRPGLSDLTGVACDDALPRSPSTAFPLPLFAQAFESRPMVTYEAELAVLPVPFRVDHRHEFDNGLVEVRRYFWSKPIEQTLQAMSDALVINMALTSRPLHTRVDRVATDNDPLAGEAGRLLIMIPGVPYHLVAPSGSFRSLHCAIGCERLDRIAGDAIDWPTLRPFAGEARASLGIETHLSRIHDELVRSNVGRENVIEACVDLICVELVRHFRRGRPARPDVHAGGLAAWRMRTILGRIHSEGPAPRLAELAELCGLTERQLGRAFKAETGTTLGRFVDEATMERAHRLLTTTSLSIAEVAKQLGFAGADSFAQSYRRATGTLPSRIRQR